MVFIDPRFANQFGSISIGSIHADEKQGYCLFLCDQVITSKCLPIRCVPLIGKENRKGDMNKMGETHVGLNSNSTHTIVLIVTDN